MRVPLVGSRAVVQGFGKVGGPLAFLLRRPACGWWPSDIGGAVLNEGGLDVALADHVAETGSVAGFGVASRSPRRRVGHRLRAAGARRHWGA